MDEEYEGPTKADLEKIGREWADRLRAAEKREKEWLDDAEKAELAYLATAKDGKRAPDFNILHSNVETIVPSIYNSTPRPEIRPRHNNRDDKVGKEVADAHERAIQALIDDNRLDKEIEAGAQDCFVAGRDIVRIRFDADDVPAEVYEDPETGEAFELSPAGIENETIIYENVSWKDYREGPAKRWRDVPWIAYRHEVSEAEKERLENQDFKAQYLAEDPYYAEKKDQEKDCSVWEIWCKETRRVYFVVEDSCRVLDIIDDPLGLKDFFPQPEPVQPVTGTGTRIPVCPFKIYETLAEELDTATRRINAIMKGLKVRGVIPGDADVLMAISELGDNEIGTVANIENLAAAGGLERAVLWWPVEQSIAVLRELYMEREQTKQAIYEVTGISDIVRGQGAASETATAQQIKTQWGSLRIKKMQRMIERQVRDLFCLSAEVLAKHFSLQTVQRLAGVQLTPEAAQAFGQWDHYRIDVESDSTIRADAGKNREEMSMFLQGTAQFMQAMAPVVQQSPQAAGPVLKIYSSFAAQFNLGKAAEDALDQAIQTVEQAAQQPPQPSPEQIEAQARMKLEEGKFQLDQARFQLDAQKAQAEHGIKVAGVELDRDKLALEEAKAEVDGAVKLNEAEKPDGKERVN